MSPIRFCLCLASTLLLALSCESEVREINIKQNLYIDNYIQNHYADNEVVRNDGAIRVVLADSLANAPAIERGDSAYLFYAGYTFGESGPMGQFALDSGMVRVGSGDLITGLDRGLIGARLGQEALIIFPAQLGYGTHAVGMVPENTALLFYILVADIKNN